MFEIYKKGQGTIARWLAAIALGGLAAFGAYELQDTLSASRFEFVSKYSAVLAALVFAGVAVLVAMLVNMPRFVDYLIHSETELRKVSWPTKTELKRQTIVVIITLAFFSVLLILADIILVYVIMDLIYGVHSQAASLIGAMPCYG